jgi:N-acetylneuraminate synthase
MATPFDEASVDLCGVFDLPLIKIASSDIATWPLLERISRLRRPVIISTGGAKEKTIDDCVRFFENRSIPLAINHCVSLYPSEDSELELNQIDYLRMRYPDHVIGFSTHEQRDWHSSMLISYSKGARTWERHIDIDHDGLAVSPYCSLPHQVDLWFKAYHKAVEMFDSATFEADFYLAIPLHRGQLSCREVINGERLIRPIAADDRLTIDHVDGPYNSNNGLRQGILERGREE